jgi:hypothetical protein
LLLGLGCHLDARVALQRAFAEMNQMLGMAHTGEGGELSLEDSETLEWLRHATVANHRPEASRCDRRPYRSRVRRGEQVIAQLLDHPPLSAEAYDFQLVQIPLRSVLPGGTFFQLSYSDVDRYEKLFEMAKGRLSQFLEAAMRWNIEYGMLTLVFNFQLP